jgi:ABC-type Zn uptake system ZnuABC Zn-binding protein ZnuA
VPELPVSRRAGTALGILGWLAAAACQAGPVGPIPPSAPGPRVVATTALVADVVGQVAGDRVELFLLLPPGADPHSYQTTPQAAAILADSDLIFINGFGLEEALLLTLESVASSVRTVSISEGIQPRELAEGEHNSGEGEAAGPDPHVWLDPHNVLIWVENARSALTDLDPAGAEAYTAQAAAYAAQLGELDAWIRAEVDQIPATDRNLVTDHDNLGYFAARYGFEIVGAVVPAYSTLAQPSAQEIADLERAIAGYGVQAVFVGVAINPALAGQVAKDMGIDLVPLYTDSLSGPEGPAATYLDLMHQLVEAIVEALGQP